MCEQCGRYTAPYDMDEIIDTESYDNEAEREAADRAVARAKMLRSATYGIAPKFAERVVE